MTRLCTLYLALCGMLVASVGCQLATSRNPLAPDGADSLVITSSGLPDRSATAVVAVLNGRTFTGEETAQVGESGRLTATFVGEPGPGVSIKLVWHSNRLNLDYEGEVTGPMDALKIRATSNPGGGTLCGYEASATMPDENTITGSYGGVGPGPCSQKRGTFVLRASPVPTVDCLTYGVIDAEAMRGGVVTFRVLAGPVQLSIVAFKLNRSSFLPQTFLRGEVKTFQVGTYTWAVQPGTIPHQEDLFCGAYPLGHDLIEGPFYDEWARRRITGELVMP